MDHHHQLPQHEQHQQHLAPPSHPPPPPPQQQQQQPQPQDVLAEARKNLQVLIDSGFSRDLLHQLVDDSRSLQLTIPTASSALPQSTSPQPQQQQQPQPPQPTSQQQAISPTPLSPQSPQSHSQPPALTIPPAPQCPPPPPPNQQPHGHSAPSAEVNLQATAPMSEDMSTMFAYPPTAPFAHRPRISVSSTSSGSSGHASIWSNHSAQSNMSWASTGSNCPRMQAPLPLPPQMTSPTAGPMMNGPNSVSPVSAGGSPANKQNIYWCTSCETSFKRKYDWKRHEDEFHERWRKYPCPEPGCNRSFWGSNSFNQHHKQCHGCTTCPHAEKVVRFLRKRKYWACGFCSALHPARERHVEHVARHFESGMTKGEWMHSRVVYGLLHQPLIHEAWDALVNSKQSDYGGRRPRFSWHPSKTGRAQGFLEKENPGQLQDLLEFFSGDEGDAQWIVSVAYDLADIVMDNAQLAPPQFQTPGAHAYGAQDPRVSFASMPQPMLQSTDPNVAPAGGAQNPYAQSFQSTAMFMNPPSFPQQARSSPDSASHSPLPSTHSPIAPTHSPVIKQEPSQHHGAEGAESGMDFEYTPTPVVFENWDNSSSLVMDDSSHSTPTPSTQSGGWGMMQYFGEPRVAHEMATQ